MNRRFSTLVAVTLWAGGIFATRLHAADAPKPDTVSVAAPAADEATQKWIDQKVTKLIETSKVTGDEKIAKVRAIGTEWFAAMCAFHKEHDAEINKLWSEWNTARSVKPKDEYPGEVISYKIEAVYAGLKPAYDNYIKALSAELTPEQIDEVKERWSWSPGMKRTYNTFLEMAPDLNDTEKEVVKARMMMAREAAMLTDAGKEVDNTFKRHKLKIEAYIGEHEWQKLRKVWADRGKATAAPKPAATPAN